MIPPEHRSPLERRLRVLMERSNHASPVDPTILRAFRAYARLRALGLTAAAVAATVAVAIGL